MKIKVVILAIVLIAMLLISGCTNVPFYSFKGEIVGKLTTDWKNTITYKFDIKCDDGEVRTYSVNRQDYYAFEVGDYISRGM